MTLRRRVCAALGVISVILIASILTLLGLLHSSQREQLDKELFATARERVGQAPSPAATSAATTVRLPDMIANGNDNPDAVRPASGSALPAVSPQVAEAHATAVSEPFAPFDVTSGGRHYRVVAVRTDVGAVVVASISTEHIEATFRLVAIGSAVIGLLVLVGVAVVVWWVERLGIGPIEEATLAANAIAWGDRSRRVALPAAGTEASRLAVSFNAMVDAREATEARLRQFVADASHELRTPLTTITGVTELLRNNALHGDDRAEALRRARSEEQRMVALIDDLLLLTVLDDGLPVATAPVDLCRLVRDAATDARMLQRERSISVEAAGEVVVLGDEQRLRQVVGNLVSNALFHTPLDAALRLRVERAGDRCVVEVADDGPGLDAEHAERVFDRFYRATPGRSRRDGGVGLGLSLAQSIVRAHCGSITLDTRPCAGCRFTIELPTSVRANFEPDASQAQTGGATFGE